LVHLGKRGTTHSVPQWLGNLTALTGLYLPTTARTETGALAIVLRPGNARSNTAADHVGATRLALA